MSDTDNNKDISVLGNESAEIETLVGSLKVDELALDLLDGTVKVIPVQPFNTFKTAQTLRMLADIRNKIDIVGLLGEMAQMTSEGNLVHCPHCKVLIDPRTATIVDEKEMIIGCEKCLLPFHLKDAPPATNENGARKVTAALSAIPTLISVAPDLLVEFASLAILSNAELALAYDKPNGIAELVRAKRKFIELDCRPDATLKILNAFVPKLGIDFLVSELGKMENTFTQLLSPLTK